MSIRLHADSADVAAISPLLHDHLIAGVTTNPTILARSGRTFDDIEELADRWHGEGASELFFQAVGRTTDELLTTGRQIADLAAVVKVPATREGFAAAATLAAGGVSTLVTAVYSVAQAVAAGAIGATYIAPYLGRLNDRGVNGFEVIEQMRVALDRTPCRILVASVRSPQDIERLVGSGITDITAAPDVIEACLRDDESEAAAAQFLADAGV